MTRQDFVWFLEDVRDLVLIIAFGVTFIGVLHIALDSSFDEKTAYIEIHHLQ